MRKYKVLQVHNYYKIPGGEDTVVANEKKMLDSNGHQVITYYRNNDELDAMGKLEKILFPFSMIFNLKTYQEIKHIIKENNIDVVHIHNTHVCVSYSAYYAARKLRVPVVQTVHNYRLICANALLYRDEHICEECLTRSVGCAVQHRCYRNSKIHTLAIYINMRIHRLSGILKNNYYIFLTEFNRKKVCSTGIIPVEKTFIKPNFTPSQSEVVDANDKKRDDYVIYIGRLDNIKGTDIALKAWEYGKFNGLSLPRLLICGNGPLEEVYKEYVSTRNIDNVEFLGYIEHQEIMNLLAKARGLVFSTKVYEGFPMSILEAYSVGTPVVAPDFGNAGDLVIQELTGMKYEQNNFESLANKVLELLNLEEIKGDLFYKEIVAYFERNYTENENYRCLMKIYEKVVK